VFVSWLPAFRFIVALYSSLYTLPFCTRLLVSRASSFPLLAFFSALASSSALARPPLIFTSLLLCAFPAKTKGKFPAVLFYTQHMAAS
jgi:hypothetical protein